MAVDVQPYRVGFLGGLGFVLASIAMLLPLVAIFAEGPENVRTMRMARLVLAGTLPGLLGFVLMFAGASCGAGGCGGAG